MCVSAGSRRKERLVSGDSEEDQDSEESRRTMDLSLLREQYRSSREAQRRHTQVLLLRTGERKHAAGSCRPEVVKLLSCCRENLKVFESEEETFSFRRKCWFKTPRNDFIYLSSCRI